MNYFKTTKTILDSLQRDGAVKEFYDIGSNKSELNEIQ